MAGDERPPLRHVKEPRPSGGCDAAQIVREQPRSTAASASRSWLLRMESRSMGQVAGLAGSAVVVACVDRGRC